MQQYTIGDILWQWAGEPLRETQRLSLFASDGAADTLPTVQFDSYRADLSDYVNQTPLRETPLSRLYPGEQGDRLVFRFGTHDTAAAIYPGQITPHALNRVALDRTLEVLPTMEWLFSLMGVHRVLLQLGGGILHGCYIQYAGQAILFTAPSGTGKSTQGSLWRQYLGAEVVNGDRVVVRRRNGVFHAFGLPNCGTSGICFNRTAPIRAIVVLSQGKENVVTEARDGVRSIAAAVQVYPWSQTEVEWALDLAENLCREVPVYHLSCRPDEDAVQTLRRAIF